MESQQKSSSKQLYALINFGQITDPADNTKTYNLQSKIPLLLPEFQLPDVDQYFRSHDFSWLIKYLKDTQFIRYDESNKEQIFNKIKDSITCCLFTLPDYEVDWIEMKIYVLFLVLSLLLDDCLEGKNFFGSNSKNDNKASKLSNVMLDIIKGKYKSVDQLPKIYPLLQPFLKGGYLFSTLSHESISNFRESCQYFCNQITYSLEATQLLQQEFKPKKVRDTTLQQPGNNEKSATMAESKINESTFNYLREYDSGALFVVELLALLRQINLPEIIRQSLYFQRLMTLATSIGTNFNDLIGIRKDLQENTLNSSSNFNCILYRMRKYGIDFLQSFRMTEIKIKDDTQEFKTIAEKLRGMNNHKLNEFIKIMETYLDGTTYWSIQTTERYSIESVQIIVEEKGQQDSENLVVGEFETMQKDFASMKMDQLSSNICLNFVQTFEKNNKKNINVGKV